MKVVLITGGAKRLGQAMAEQFAAEGWQVCVHYHHSACDAANLVARLPQARSYGLDLLAAAGAKVHRDKAPLAQSLGLRVAADSGGLVILGIDPNSDSGQKGLQRGDIVVTANYRPVNTVADLEGIVSQAKAANRESVLLRIQRRGRPLTYVPIRLR